MRTKRFYQNARTGLRDMPKTAYAVETCAKETRGLNDALQRYSRAPTVGTSRDPVLFPEARSFGCCVFEGGCATVLFHPALEDRDNHVVFGVVGHEIGHLLSYGEPVPEGMTEEQYADLLFEQATGLEIWYTREMIQTAVTPSQKPLPDWVRPRPAWVGK